MHKQSALIASVLVALSPLLTQSAQAAVPSTEAVKAAISKSNLLDPNFEVVTSVDPANADHVLVSTFLHRSATDRDCKIDSLLIGKTIIDLADGAVSRVTVSFFSTQDLSTYKQVSVKSLDVKAFSAGAVNKDELLKNIDIIMGQTADSPSNLTALLRQATMENALQVALADQELDLTAQADLSRNELNTRLEVLQLAQNGLAAAPAGVKTLVVKLQDAFERNRFKQVTFDVAELQSMMAKLQVVLNPVAIITAPVSSVVQGAFQGERQKLYTRIASLGKQGVGVQSFVGLFKFIEANVSKNDQAVLRGNIDRLSNALDEQEARMVAVKNRASQLKKEEKEEKVTAALPASTGKKHADYVTLGGDEFIEDRARTDPDEYARLLQSTYMTNPVKPALAKRFASGLQRISELMRENHRDADADKFQRWAADIRNKYQ